jgi:hypothetical protein
MDHQLIGAFAIEMKDASFAVIDPDDGMMAAGHFFSCTMMNLGSLDIA